MRIDHLKNSEMDETKCRACMLNARNFTNIFEGNISELFKKFTNLMLTQEDQLPQIICTKCKRRLEDFEEFHTKCLESDLQFRMKLVKQETEVNVVESVSNFIDTNSNNDFSSTNDYDFEDNFDIKEEEEEEEEFSEHQLDLIASNNDVESTNEKQKSKLKRNFTKKICIKSRDSENEEKLLIENLPLIKKKVRRYKNAYLDKYRGHFICPVPACNKTFVFEKSLHTHMKIHDPNYNPDTEPRPYICEHCGNSFKKEGQLNAHLKDKHGPPQIHCCRDCKQSFSTKTRLRMHRQREHETPKVYSCDICNKAIGRSHAAIRSHMLFIHLNNDHPCTTCGKSFKRPFELRKHIEWDHLGESKFVCNICGAKFRSKQMLNYHQFHHSNGEKQFKCTYCDWSSRKQSDLKRHIDYFHLGIKRHTCQYCEKSFFDPKVKKHHEMTHTGERPEVCPICSKRFIQKIALRKHMQTHEKS